MSLLPRPLLLCGRCGAWAAALLAVGLGCLEAYLRWEVRAAAAERAPALVPVDTFDEADLPREVFYRDYVLKRRPVKIRLSNPEKFNTTQLLEHCGSTARVHLISDATYTVLIDINEQPWLRFAFNWLLMPLLGKWTTLQDEMSSRLKVPLEDYMAYAEGPSFGGEPREFALPLPLFLLRVLPTELVLLMDVFARPKYLHDTSLRFVCPAAQSWYHVPRLLLPTWLFAGSPESFDDRMLDTEPTFFMGRAQTMSYPMHQNLRADLDFTLVALQGRKRYSIFPRSQHRNLSPFAAGDALLYTVSAFWPDLIQSPRFSEAVGWKGTLEAGEMLFSPGDSIHSFENFDFSGQTVAIKYWSLPHHHACPGESAEVGCAARLGIDLPDTASAEPTILDYKAQGRREREKAKALRSE